MYTSSAINSRYRVQVRSDGGCAQPCLTWPSNTAMPVRATGWYFEPQLGPFSCHMRRQAVNPQGNDHGCLSSHTMATQLPRCPTRSRTCTVSRPADILYRHREYCHNASYGLVLPSERDGYCGEAQAWQKSPVIHPYTVPHIPSSMVTVVMRSSQQRLMQHTIVLGVPMTPMRNVRRARLLHNNALDCMASCVSVVTSSEGPDTRETQGT
jgi:hypothetical protein